MNQSLWFDLFAVLPKAVLLQKKLIAATISLQGGIYAESSKKASP